MAKVIISHNSPNYVRKWEALEEGKYNGEYYYSQDIEKYIAPELKTNRPINTIGIKSCGGRDHMIIFAHNYLYPERYSWLLNYSDVIIVSSDSKAEKILERYGKIIHLPLSVPVDEIKKHCVKKKTQEACYYGNPWKFKQREIAELVPPEVHRFAEMPREKAWDIIAQYKYCYANGLCAEEAQVLGCKLKMSRYRYPDPEKAFPVLDCKDAAKMLQNELNKIDNKK